MSTKDNKITFDNEHDVKKWLRSIPVTKKEMELKIRFYEELAGDFATTAEWQKQVDEYRKKVLELKGRLERQLSECDRLFNLLEESERLVLTAKYIKAIRWDFIEMHIFYSRRQAIRIRDAAVAKLIGQTVEL